MLSAPSAGERSSWPGGYTISLNVTPADLVAVNVSGIESGSLGVCDCEWKPRLMSMTTATTASCPSWTAVRLSVAETVAYFGWACANVAQLARRTHSSRVRRRFIVYIVPRLPRLFQSHDGFDAP